MKKLFFTLAILLLNAVIIQAQNNQNEQTITALNKSLATAATPGDSIKILYDIFDLSTRKQQSETARIIYNIAERTGDNTTRLDILRLLTSCFKEDRIFEQLLKEARRLPASKERSETELFIQMKRLSFSSRHMSEAQRQKVLINILANYDSLSEKKHKSQNPRQRFLDLYTVVEYLRNEATGDMLKEYLDKLIEMANSTDFELYALGNIVYSEASNIYSDAGDAKKAVESDRRLLGVIDALEKRYKARGRQYRNYDISRYVVYRRMLRNFKALTPDEIENAYQKIKQLADKNSEVREDLTGNPRCMAYYNMAVGNYHEAIPLLKSMLQDDSEATQVRKQVLEHLITAAEHTGDDETKMEALTQYNTILEELNKTNAAEKYRELQIKYDIQDLKNRNTTLEIDNREKELSSSRRIMTFVIAAFLILAVTLLILLWNWRKYRLNAQRMGNMVDNIHLERKRLRHQVYSDYADKNGQDVDVRSLEVKSWQKRMKELSLKYDQASTFMTDSITSDLLYLSSIGLDDSLKFIDEISVDTLLRRVESNIIEKKGSGCKFRIDYPEDDFTIVTDSECLVYILTHGLDVATKYYPEKTVMLSVFDLDKDHIGIYLTIEDVRMASLVDPQLFTRLNETENILSKENGGMFLCRMILFQLNCLRVPDISYTKGTRYFVRVPKALHVG